MDYNQNNNQYQNYNQQQNFNQYPNFNQVPQGQYNPYGYVNYQQPNLMSQEKFLKLREQKNEIRRFAKIIAFFILIFANLLTQKCKNSARPNGACWGWASM